MTKNHYRIIFLFSLIFLNPIFLGIIFAYFPCEILRMHFCSAGKYGNLEAYIFFALAGFITSIVLLIFLGYISFKKEVGEQKLKIFPADTLIGSYLVLNLIMTFARLVVPNIFFQQNYYPESVADNNFYFRILGFINFLLTGYFWGYLYFLSRIPGFLLGVLLLGIQILLFIILKEQYSEISSGLYYFGMIIFLASLFLLPLEQNRRVSVRIFSVVFLINLLIGIGLTLLIKFSTDNIYYFFTLSIIFKFIEQVFYFYAFWNFAKEDLLLENKFEN